MDEKATEFTSEWISKARIDRRSARVLLEADPVLAATALFHCQQSVEKMLKAFLTYHAQLFEKTHDLGRLCDLCSKIDSQFNNVREPVSNLSAGAVNYRYPGTVDPTEQDARKAIGVVHQIWTFVLDRLPEQLQQTHELG